ncbi:Uncharacterised protein [Enterobacter cloacae]|nr:Uncharacterised protein [Enterobacter cloacae]
MQSKKIDNLGEMIFKARESMVTALFYSLAAGCVIRHCLAVIQHFISRLLQQPDKIGRFKRVDLHNFEIVNMA